VGAIETSPEPIAAGPPTWSGLRRLDREEIMMEERSVDHRGRVDAAVLAT